MEKQTINKYFLKKVIELELLGVPASTSALPLSEIYLVNMDNFMEYFIALQDNEYRKLTTLNNVLALINWQSTYGTEIYGKTDVEREILQAKENAFTTLSKINGEDDISFESMLRHADNAYAMTLIGLCYFFGLGIEKNDQLGSEYLTSAAKNNDFDAKLWSLCKNPQKAEAIIADMATLPELMANPALLENIKKHYHISTEIVMGFHITNIGF